MLPSALDQFSRTRLPHYTGYKPRGGQGATVVQPAQGPTIETTQGFVNNEVGFAGPLTHVVGWGSVQAANLLFEVLQA